MGIWPNRPSGVTPHPMRHTRPALLTVPVAQLAVQVSPALELAASLLVATHPTDFLPSPCLDSILRAAGESGLEPPWSSGGADLSAASAQVLLKAAASVADGSSPAALLEALTSHYPDHPLIDYIERAWLPAFASLWDRELCQTLAVAKGLIESVLPASGEVDLDGLLDETSEHALRTIARKTLVLVPSAFLCPPTLSLAHEGRLFCFVPASQWQPRARRPPLPPQSGPMQWPITRLTFQFKALACPTRLSLLTLVVDRSLAVGALARHLGISRSSASHHVSVLARVGLVTTSQAGHNVYVRCSLSRRTAASCFMTALGDARDKRDEFDAQRFRGTW
jgi:DNA-binding transcriptional ArsR family regulator